MSYLKGRRPSGSMIVAIIALVAVLGGSAYAAAKITGKDIKNSTITTKDVKDGTLRSQDFSDEAKDSLRGANGPQGVTGATGSAGADGTDGEDGTDGVDGEDGTDGVDGEDGTDGVDGEDGQDVGPTEFAVVRLYRNGTAVASSFSPDVPDDGNNAAQVAGSTVTACQGGDEFSLEAAYRTDEADGGQAGGGLVITFANGDLVGGGQTAPNPNFPGTSVVEVDPVAKTSGEPIGNNDDELVSVTLPGTVPAGQCVIEGTVQAFDFDDSNGVEG